MSTTSITTTTPPPLRSLLTPLPALYSLPPELLFTLLVPLITPHKESRDHHLLVYSPDPAGAASLVRNVHSPIHTESAYMPSPHVDVGNALYLLDVHVLD
jgi:hypothetical protein